MRLLQLLDGEELILTGELTRDIPPYAILSHTWEENGEVTFQDVSHKSGKNKAGYEKILFCGRQAKRDGFDYFWVDTCCIDKTSSAELTEAINSMFRWYRDAAVCYVYLKDVSTGSVQNDQTLRLWDSQFRQSRWYTRGWTLQELLAPRSVKFFSREGAFLGDKSSLEAEIHSITNIPTAALRGAALSQFPTHDRLAWAHSRRTTKEEDEAYCLLGIFEVFLPLIYGEGKRNAMTRLLEKVNQQTGASDFSTLPHRPNQQVINQEPHLILPFGRNRGFVGRDSILAELARKILPSAEKDDCQRTVLEGLGGVGKTQIALEAAYRVQEQDPNCSIFWVPAITLTTLENAYRDIGQALGTPGIQDEKDNVKSLVKTALERHPTSWLLIIDNVDDINLLNNEGLREYIPFSRKGSILFTTRNHEVAVELDASLNILKVNGMSESEAGSLLRSGLDAHQVQDNQATEKLLKHLAYLPLAIKQASAYMAKRGTTITRYLQYCLESDEKQTKLLSAEFEDRWRYSKETNPIATAWLVSFQHLESTYPLAVEYLKFICFLAEKNIPISLLPRGEDQEAEDEAIGVLKGYAFISIREQGDAFDIHRLVRLATRNWVKQEWEVCYTKAIQRLAEVYPFPKHENRQTWMAYMPHAQVALVDHERCGDEEAEADLLQNVAISYDNVANYNEAEKLFREALGLRKSVLGAEHPSTLDSINSVAIVLDKLGKYDKAEEMHRQALELRKSVLGAKHPSTLESMNNLAVVLDTLGKYDEAEEMHRQALELRKSVLSAEHPSTLESINNLANVLDKLGKYDEAEEMHRQALELKKSVLGAEHPSTLDSINNLALVLDKLGKYDKAEEMHRQALELRKSVLGAEHPSTLNSMNNLALVLGKLGKYKEAEEMHREELESTRSIQGATHPSTCISIYNLGNVLIDQGKYDEAEEMHRLALELRKSVIGAEHPYTLDSMHGLADVLENLGKQNEAEEIYREIIKLQTQVFGSTHPNTLQTSENLRLLLENREEYHPEEVSGPKRSFVQALKDRLRHHRAKGTGKTSRKSAHLRQ